MAVKSKLDIEVDSEEFKRFYANFLAFQGEMKKLPAAWAELAQATNKQTKAEEAKASAIMRYVDVAGAAARSSMAGMMAASVKMESVWSNLARETKGVASNLATMTASLFSWGLFVGAIGSLVGGAAGLFGLEGMADSVSGQRRRAMAMGSSLGEAKAFPLNFGRFLDTDLLFRGVSAGYYNQTGPEYTSMLMSGVQGVGKGGVASNALQMLHRLPGLFPQGMSKDQIGPRMQQYGLDHFFTPEGVAAYTQNATPEERAEQDRRYAEDIRTLDMNDATAQAWQDFILQLDNSKSAISTSFAEGLSGLAGPLTDLSDAIANFVTTLVNDRQTDIGKWAHDAGDGLSYFAAKISDPAFTKDVNAFLTGAAGWASTLRDVAGGIGKFGGAIGYLVEGKAWWDFNHPGAHEAQREPTSGGLAATRQGGVYSRWHDPSRYLPFKKIAPVTTPSDLTAPLPKTDPTTGKSSDYSGVNLGGRLPVAGGPVEPGLIMLARHLQQDDPDTGVFTAFNDDYHHAFAQGSLHNRGLAFDVTEKQGDYDAARDRVRAYLTKLGLQEGDLSGHTGDFAIEPGTQNHMHVQFNSPEAAARYAKMMTAATSPAAAPGNLFGTPDFAFGDSTLASMNLPGSAVVGRSPRATKNALYDFLNSPAGADIKGKKFLLSSNSNDPSETGLEWVEFMAKTIQMSGGIVDIMGGGDRSDIAAWNKPLADFAAEHGMSFTPMGPTGADQVHERSPSDQLERVRQTPAPAAAPMHDLHSSLLEHYHGLYDSSLIHVDDHTHGSVIMEYS